MKKIITLIGFIVVILTAGIAQAQSTTVSCTDSTNTNCTIKKNQPFDVTADPALTTDVIYTQKWKMYVDGQLVASLDNVGQAPLFNFGAGLSTTGDHTMYLEAIGTAFDVTGAPVEVSSGPGNTVTVHIVTGSLSAPKNTHIK